jgi:hypothetical protein
MACDAILPARQRRSGIADRPVAELLHRLGVILPHAPKIVENVVDKITPLIDLSYCKQTGRFSS